MYCGQKLSERIYWTGVYDRRKHLFENMWPLPEGVSYNSYLIKDEKCALMDTVESGSDRSYADWVSESLDGRPLDYLIIHHMELDHSGEIENLVQRYPDVKIVGNCKTFRVLEAYFGTSMPRQKRPLKILQEMDCGNMSLALLREDICAGGLHLQEAQVSDIFLDNLTTLFRYFHPPSDGGVHLHAYILTNPSHGLLSRCSPWER